MTADLASLMADEPVDPDWEYGAVQEARNALRAELRPLVAALVEERDRLRECGETALGLTTAFVELQRAIKDKDVAAANMWMSVVKGADAVLESALSRAALTGEDKG